MTSRNALLALVVLILALGGTAASAPAEVQRSSKLRVVYLSDFTGCSGLAGLVCKGALRSARAEGVDVRVVTPTARESVVDTLELLSRQQYDLIVGWGGGLPEAVGVVGRRHRGQRYAMLDRSRDELTRPLRNVQGVVFRTSEAAFVAGWVAGRLERTRPGRDVVGIVAGVPFPGVDDFVVGFRAGARRASPRVRVLTSYSFDFVDEVKCRAIARSQIAKGAGVIFNVAGVCGLGAMQAAKQHKVWVVGVDEDQSFLGPHVLTSVLKRFDVGFATLYRQLKSGKLALGHDTVLTYREGAVGLAPLSSNVPRALRKGALELERKIARGAVRVPGVYEDPR